MSENGHLSGLNRVDGRTALVTGANSGIGKQIALNLASLGAHVTMACRSLERGQTALEEIAAEVPGAAVELIELDQSSQASVRDCASTFLERHDSLDILINNAGIYPESRRLSVDDIELTFATNVMGYFQLTRELRPALAGGAEARVIFIASALAGEFDQGDLQFERRKFGGIKAYKQSKAANRMLARRFAERFASDSIAVAAVHPGGIRTSIGRHQKGLWGLLVRLAFRTQKPVTAGADTATWLATRDAFESGQFWADREARECEFNDEAAEAALWDACEALLVAR